MTSTQIRALAMVLPEKSAYPAGLPADASRFDRVRRCLGDPCFPWNFVQAFIAAGDRLPMEARLLPFLVKAYRWRTRKSDEPAIEEAHSLLHPAASAIREVLNALLICPTVPLDEIAGHLGLTAQVVDAYAALFFNVRDRLQDKYFLGQLCFPGTRLASMDGSAATPSRAQRLLQAARDLGPEEVLYLAGIRSQTEGADAEHELKVLEQSLARKSKDLVRHGQQEAKELLVAARALLVMGKRSGAAKAPAYSGSSIGASIASELLAREDNWSGLDHSPEAVEGADSPESGCAPMPDLATIKEENARLQQLRKE